MNRIAGWIIRFRYFLLLSLVCILVGCAYFNAFYLAKKSFQDGERERLKEGKTGVGHYSKAAANALKLLKLYPESKWCDDALFLLGKSRYFQNQYQKALQRLVELENNYPDSPHFNEARYYRGLALEKSGKRTS